MKAMYKFKLQILAAGALFAAAGAHADGDAARGKQLFEECAACHSLEGGAQGVGPSLKGVFGRKAGELAEFRYSPAMKKSGIAWTEKTMDAFVADPQNEIKGNRMPFSGMPDVRARSDLIAYLREAAK